MQSLSKQSSSSQWCSLALLFIGAFMLVASYMVGEAMRHCRILQLRVFSWRKNNNDRTYILSVWVVAWCLVISKWKTLMTPWPWAKYVPSVVPNSWPSFTTRRSLTSTLWWLHPMCTLQEPLSTVLLYCLTAEVRTPSCKGQLLWAQWYTCRGVPLCT